MEREELEVTSLKVTLTKSNIVCIVKKEGDYLLNLYDPNEIV